MKLELVLGLVALPVKIGEFEALWRVCVGVEKKKETIIKLEFSSEGRKGGLLTNFRKPTQMPVFSGEGR